jgi:hypothetical protein
MLQAAAGTAVGERERESCRSVGESEIQPGDHWNQPYGVNSYIVLLSLMLNVY